MIKSPPISDWSSFISRITELFVSSSKKVILNDRHFSLTQFRAKYCKELKVTIEKFDHFCPWTGNGVGIRNYHLFFFFLVFTNIHAFFVGFTSLKASAKKTEYRTLLIVLTVYCIGIICLVGFLLIYHISIINKIINTVLANE